MKFTNENFTSALPLPRNDKRKGGVWDIEAFAKRGVSLVFFTPRVKDYQTFHDEDEFYFIISGNGEMLIGEDRFDFLPGDAFFVPAKTFHRFEKFSEDFATRAVFF